MIQGYLNHPDIERPKAIGAIRALNKPMLTVQVRALRQAYKDFQISSDVKALLDSVLALAEKFGGEDSGANRSASPGSPLRRDDLRLICFDLITGA